MHVYDSYYRVTDVECDPVVVLYTGSYRAVFARDNRLNPGKLRLYKL